MSWLLVCFRFEYSISQMDVSQKTLDVCVKNNISLFSKDKKKEIGKVEIDLSEYDLTKAHTEWYVLGTSYQLIRGVGGGGGGHSPD